MKRLHRYCIFTSSLFLVGLFLIAPASGQYVNSIGNSLLEVQGNNQDPAVTNFRQSVRLSAVQSGDDRWSSMFGRPGLDLIGTSVAVDGENVYVGGIFFTAGDSKASSIAVWNTGARTWASLGEGLADDDFAYGTVWDIEIADNKVYVAGDFDTAGGSAANNIAVWDIASRTWSTLGNGFDGPVNTIAISGNSIFVGGAFDSLGANGAATTQVNHVARWNGSSWSGLGSGVDSDVISLVVLKNELYAGGSFSTAGGTAANFLAKWDGSSWSGLIDNENDNGVNGTVYEMENAGDSVLYFGGSFVQAGGEAANAVAKWSPTAMRFSALGPGVNSSEGTATVYSLAVDNGFVYVAGGFDATGISSAQQVARWDISQASWSSLGEGLASSDVLHHGLEAADGVLYVAGFMFGAGDQTVQGIAEWDGASWMALDSAENNLGLGGGTGFGIGAALAVEIMSDGVIVAGEFRQAGSQAAHEIAQWNESGSEWMPLGDGLSDSDNFCLVWALASDGPDVYAGGDFSFAGGAPAENIAVWNSTSNSWSPLGAGVDGIVYDILILNGTVYAGGSFETAGGTTVNGIASWNGSNWNALGAGVKRGTRSGMVRTLAALNGELYVGGRFDAAGGTTANNIAKWDGTSWSALIDAGGNNGVDNTVQVLHVMEGGLLALGGNFENAGGVSANRVAQWNSDVQEFSAFGPGFNNTVQGLEVYNDTLYASGAFSATGISSISSIARWDGQSWQSLGSGTNGFLLGETRLLKVDESREQLWVGGLITRAGGKMSAGIARYDLSASGGVAIDDPVAHTFALEGNTPNPVSGRTTIRYSLAEPATVSLTVYDVIGRRVATVVDGERQSVGPHDVDVNMRNLPAGVYFYQLDAGNRKATHAMTVVR